jgi:site-specific recombinase XerD
LLTRSRRGAAGPEDPLFYSVQRTSFGEYEPFGGEGIAQMISTVAERAQLRKRVHAHLFRHSWMTEMLRGGMNPIQLSAIAGASQQVIASNYEHLNEDDAHAAMIKALRA